MLVINYINTEEQILILLITLIASIIMSHYAENFIKRLIKFIYAKFTGRGKRIEIILDSSGIPVVDYKYIDGVYIGKQKNPVTVMQTALDYYKNYENGNNDNIQGFLNCAKWLTDNAVIRNDYAIFEYHFPWPAYNMTSPWYSGMAQGQALQVLIRAYKLTNDKKYFDTAKKILNSFYIEVKDNGVTYKTEQDGWWYEENACKDGKVSRILNGMIFTLLGIYEYYEYTKYENAKYLFQQGVIALKKNLPLYDMNGFSYYDILNAPAWEYHNIHIQLLEHLHKITNEEIFKKYYDKWKNHIESFFIVRLIKNPNKRCLMILFFNFLILLLLIEIIVFLI